MSNNEKFNALLNSCANPRKIYNALLALAEAGYTLKSLNQALEDVAPTGRKGVAGGQESIRRQAQSFARGGRTV